MTRDSSSVAERLVEAASRERFASRAANGAALASYLALSATGRAPVAGRVLPALAVRHHVRLALQQLGATRRKHRRSRTLTVVGVLAVLAVGASARKREGQEDA